MGIGAEIPIPIVSDPDEPSTSTAQPLANVTNRESISQRGPLPTISVTKPPMPMPISLPTPDDILVLEPAPAPPNHTDLEAGGDMMMREIETPVPPSKSHTVQLSSSTSTVKPAGAATAVPTLPPPPASPTAPHSSSPSPISPAIPAASPAAPSTPAKSPTPQPDLLTDSPALRAKSPPPLPEATFSVQSEDSPVLIGSDDARPPSLDINLSNSSAEGSSNDGVLVSDPEPDSPADKAVADALGFEELSISTESAHTANPASKP